MIRRIGWLPALLIALSACSKGAATAASSQPAASPPQPTTPSAATSAPAPAATSVAPSPASAGAVHYYDCVSLLSDPQIEQATGLSDATLFSEEHGEAVKGQTYCAYSAKGALSIAVSVFTGPAFDQVFTPLETAAGNASPVSGLGDWAGWSGTAAGLGTRVGSTGVTIFFTNTGGGPLGVSDPEGAAVAMARLVLSRL